MELITKYFPSLTERQQEQFKALDALYHDWNSKINVISRKDIDNLYLHHVLHSLAIAKLINFKPKTKILDFGCGGGFQVISAIGLHNVVAEQRRGEEEKGQYDFIVSRAVMPLPDLVKIVRKNISKKSSNAFPNGIITLKGGELQSEIQSFRNIIDKTELTSYFEEEWFKEKFVLYLPN